MIGERETRRLLAAIRDLAVLAYPYEDAAPLIDARYLVALGQIAAIAGEALTQGPSNER